LSGLPLSKGARNFEFADGQRWRSLRDNGRRTASRRHQDDSRQAHWMRGSAMPLEQFETLALTLDAPESVDDASTPDTSDPVKLDPLVDPSWTNCGG
jgi:hypothetical protein